MRRIALVLLLTLALPCAGYEAHKMLCTWNWPYQSIENNFYNNVDVVDGNLTTNGRRFAWGVKLGAIGRDSYANYVGNTVTQAQFKSYSTFVVLGEHNPGASIDPTTTQVWTQDVLERQLCDGTTLAPAGLFNLSS